MPSYYLIAKEEKRKKERKIETDQSNLLTRISIGIQAFKMGKLNKIAKSFCYWNYLMEFFSHLFARCWHNRIRSYSNGLFQCVFFPLCVAIFLLIHYSSGVHNVCIICAHAVVLCDNEFTFHIYSQPIYILVHTFTMHNKNKRSAYFFNTTCQRNGFRLSSFDSLFRLWYANSYCNLCLRNF